MTKLLTKSICVLGLSLLLASCGAEGTGNQTWEKVLSKKYFPYGNQRTAGSGVAYVLAKIMPQRGLKLEAETSDPGIEGLMRAVERKIEPLAMEAESTSPAVIHDIQKALRKTLRK